MYILYKNYIGEFIEYYSTWNSNGIMKVLLPCKTLCNLDKLKKHCFCRSAWTVNSAKLISTKLSNKIVTAICFLQVTIFSFVRLHEYILCMLSSNLISVDIDWKCFMIKIDYYIVWMGILGKYSIIHGVCMYIFGI